MNYQFIRDVAGSPIAELEMGCETFSRWFSEEIGTDQNKIDQVLVAIVQLQNKQIRQFELRGKEINLSMDADEVEVRSTDLDYAEPEELPEGTELYDQESMAGCGLEDFTRVLKAWNDFVA